MADLSQFLGGSKRYRIADVLDFRIDVVADVRTITPAADEFVVVTVVTYNNKLQLTIGGRNVLAGSVTASAALQNGHPIVGGIGEVVQISHSNNGYGYYGVCIYEEDV